MQMTVYRRKAFQRQYWNTRVGNWRRGRDSNSRCPCEHNGFRVW